jgi:hypothetical protein
MLDRQRQETEKAGMVSAAFNAWLMGAGQKLPLKKYLKQFNLIDPEPEITPEQKEAIKNEAISKADKILRAFRRGKKRK